MDINSQQQRGQYSVRRRSLDGFDAALARSRTGSTPVRAARPVRPPAPQPTVEKFPVPRYEAPKRPLLPLRKRLSKRKLALRSAGVCGALALGIGGFLVWNGYIQLHKVFHGTSTVAALSGKRVAPSLLKGEGDGRVNILLLGIGGQGHDGPDLTDTMLVLSVDPVNHTAAFLSVPRDMWVKMPVNYFGNHQKINAAYESGKYNYLGQMDASNANAGAVEAGFKSTDEVVSQVLGININYHVLVNFQAFRQAINTVGGVTIDVKTPLIDPTMRWENNWNPVLAKAGVQQMNGKQALLYARSRETTSDFARTERQRQIMIALKDKVLTAGTLSNPTKVDGLMNAFGNNVYSDLSTQGAMRLVTIMKGIGDQQIGSIGLADPPHQFVTTDHVGNLSVVRPLAGFNNYAAIQSYVRSQLPDGYLVKEHAPVTIVAKTTAGADTTAALLKSYGYNVTATLVNPEVATHVAIINLSKGKDPYTLHYLKSRYAAKPTKNLPAGLNLPAGSAKFVILTSR